MKKSITFFFPYYKVSGVPILFLSLAEFISTHYSYDVFIIDYKDGYMALNRKKTSKVKLIEFEDGIQLQTSETILVMQAILPYAIRPELLISNNTRVFFWVLYPEIFFPSVFPFNFIPAVTSHLRLYQIILKTFYKKLFSNVRDFVVEMSSNRSLLFMDSSNLNRTNEILKLRLQPNCFLPIACKENYGHVKKQSAKTGDLNISWVGRICDFKVYILLYLIENLSLFAKKTEKKIIFHVIGNGSHLGLIQNSSVSNDFFRLNLVGEIQNDKLNDYFSNFIDINAAMGTSALESAKLGIPTILLDFSHKKIDGDYVFRWLHDTIDFDLGHKITSLDFEKDNDSLEKILEKFYTNKGLLSDMTLNYFRDNHSIRSVCEEFIENLAANSMRFGDIKSSYFEKSLLRKLYEYKKYKIWCQ